MRVTHWVRYRHDGATGFGTPGTTTIKGGDTKVPFKTSAFSQYAQEIASDERAHVSTLRAAIANAGGQQPAAFPAIDLQSSFNNFAIAAGVIVPGQTFDPFADEVSFLFGAFIFEDVGVTAYYGGTKLLTSTTALHTATGILAVESAHAAIVRQSLFAAGGSGVANRFAALRAQLNGKGKERDLNVAGAPILVPTSGSGLVLARKMQGVLDIVYGAQGATSGLFFPQGMNLPS